MKGIDPKKLFSIANTIEDKNLVVVSFEELASIMLNMKEKAFREVTLSNLIKANLYAIKMINESYGQGINYVGYYDDNFPDTLRHIINEDGKLALESLVYENINFLRYCCWFHLLISLACVSSDVAIYGFIVL